MRFNGTCNWPPVWKETREVAPKTLTGEVGTLSYVYASENVSNKIYLVINHQRENYIGSLVFDEHAFCAKIARLMRSQIGKSITEIGDLELP